MPRPNYSRAVREAAEKISVEDVADQPHIVALQKRVDRLEGEHQALVARQRKVREAAQALEARIEELKAEVANKRAALPGIALEALLSGDLEVTAAVEAREELQRLTWQIEAATDALAQFRARTLTSMTTEGEQSGNAVNSAAYALEEAIEAARLQMAYDND
jgi:chromosome segregation ATPase